MHVPGEDLLFLIAVQQWVQSSMSIKLPLLDGVFVLVPSAQLQQPAGCGAPPAAAPWRLRQVLAVEAAPGVDPADATLVLVGGQRVRAGAVKQGQLAETPDYQVSSRQLSGSAGLGLQGYRMAESLKCRMSHLLTYPRLFLWRTLGHSTCMHTALCFGCAPS